MVSIRGVPPLRHPPARVGSMRGKLVLTLGRMPMARPNRGEVGQFGAFGGFRALSFSWLANDGSRGPP